MEKKEYVHPIQKTSRQPNPQSFLVNRTESKIRDNPPVLRFAKKLGVDLSKVIGTGRNGHITRQDVEGYLINIK